MGTNGSDNRGVDQAQNRNTPFRTIQRGVNEAFAGDTVLVLPGTYTENVFFGRSGNRGAEILLRSEQRSGARVIGWISSNDQSFLTVEGFDVTNTSSIPPTKGISFVRCHHVTVRNCTVHNCYGGGIAFDLTDWVLCEWNLVFDNAFFNPGQHSGISIYQPDYRGDDDRTYGIIIRNNTSFGNRNLVNNPGFGRPTDGNGIVLDDYLKRQGGGVPYDRMTMVENNLVFGNGGNGIHNFSSQNIRIRNNTCVGNTSSFDFGGEISISESDRIYVYNNIVSASPNRFAMHQSRSTNFLAFNNVANGPFFNTPSDGAIFTNDIFAPGTFRLSPTSPAIDRGLDAGDHFPFDINGEFRFENNIDIGAAEF